MQNFKPLLAGKADIENLSFPLIATPKIDGIRAMTGLAQTIVSRNMKPIPNLYIQEKTKNLPEFLDGELLTYTNGIRDDFNTAQSKIMRRDGTPDFRFHVFDYFLSPELPYTQRLAELKTLFRQYTDILEYVPTITVTSIAQLDELEKEYVDNEGWEGVMLRKPDGRYKFGRSTSKEMILVKHKRFEDDEAVISGTIERMHNSNEPTKDALGYTERSTAKSGMIGMNTLGAISVTWKGVSFEIGTGFNDTLRDQMWSVRDTLIGKSVTFRFQGTGTHGAPRFPVFVGFRGDI